MSQINLHVLTELDAVKAKLEEMIPLMKEELEKDPAISYLDWGSALNHANGTQIGYVRLNARIREDMNRKIQNNLVNMPLTYEYSISIKQFENPFLGLAFVNVGFEKIGNAKITSSVGSNIADFENALMVSILLKDYASQITAVDLSKTYVKRIETSRKVNA